MDAIIVLIGLFIGIAIFLFVMEKITAIVYSCSSVAFTFFICWGIGIVLAWIAWRIAIIIGIIALIGFLISKLKGHKKSDNQNDDENAENSEANSSQNQNDGGE